MTRKLSAPAPAAGRRRIVLAAALAVALGWSVRLPPAQAQFPAAIPAPAAANPAEGATRAGAALPPPAAFPARPPSSTMAPAPHPGEPPASSTTEANPGGTLRLTLSEALQRARDASAHLAELRSLAAAAGAGLTGARAERLPQLDVSAGYSRLSDVPELRIDVPGLGVQTLFPNLPDNYRGHLGLALPLFTAGRIASTVTANAQQLVAANQDFEQGRVDLVLETATAYWNLVTDLDSERVLAASLADYDAHLKEARDRRDVGMAASNEVLAVEVLRDEAELARLRAASAAAVANANLLRLLGLPPETRVEPVEPLAQPPLAQPQLAQPQLAATAATAGTAGTAGPPPPASGTEPPETLIAAAAEARPEIVALRSRIAANHAGAAAARAALRPQASLSAGYDYDNPNPRILPLEARWKSSWSIGATVSLSLFDGGRTAAAAAQIDAQADALGHRLEDLERRVRLEVTQRLLELATARQAAAVSDRSLESARENVRVALDRYREGVIPSSELLDAETALLRAGLDRTTTLAQVRLALAGLQRALGR